MGPPLLWLHQLFSSVAYLVFVCVFKMPKKVLHNSSFCSSQGRGGELRLTPTCPQSAYLTVLKDPWRGGQRSRW